MQTGPAFLEQLRCVEPVFVLGILVGLFALSIFLVRTANQTEWALARILQPLEKDSERQKTFEF